MPSRRDAAVVAVWSAYWIGFFAIDPGLDGLGLWVALLSPNFVLGLAVGRWWTALLPFGLVALVPLADDACVDVDCGEISAIPDWVVVLAYVAPRGALAVLVGVASRRLLDRRYRGPRTPTPTRASHLARLRCSPS